jgi:ribonuclease BN (tRNA processing enzyme)
MSDVRVTVLGSAGTLCGPGQACSSYLLESDGARLLLDCGNGSLANLQQRVGLADVDAVVLSHLHPDHFVDLYGLYYGLRFHPDGEQSVDVYARAGAQDFVRQLLPSEASETFERVCRFTTVSAGDAFAVGPFRVSLFPANHPVEAFAMRVETDERVVAYSGDTGPTDDLIGCARDADLFIADSSWLERDGPHPEGIHMTGLEAGQHAAAAGARRLVVTHVYPTLDRAEVAAEAASAYDGEVVIARDLQEHLL